MRRGSLCCAGAESGGEARARQPQRLRRPPLDRHLPPGAPWVQMQPLTFKPLTFKASPSKPHLQPLTFNPPPSKPHLQPLTFNPSPSQPHLQSLAFNPSPSTPHLQPLTFKHLAKERHRGKRVTAHSGAACGWLCPHGRLRSTVFGLSAHSGAAHGWLIPSAPSPAPRRRDLSCTACTQGYVMRPPKQTVNISILGRLSFFRHAPRHALNA